MAADEWPQRLIRFTDWSRAEATAVEHLLPVLIAHESELAQWSFLRKFPWWRLRYRAAGPDTAKALDAALDELVDAMSSLPGREASTSRKRQPSAAPPR